MDGFAVELAKLLARTIENMMNAECLTPVRLSDDCIRVIAESIAAVHAGHIKLSERATR